jgi:hypothetical protein
MIGLLRQDLATIRQESGATLAKAQDSKKAAPAPPRASPR